MRLFWRRVRKHLAVYLILIFAIVIVWNAIFGFLTRVPAEEAVRIFIASGSAEFTDTEALRESAPAYIRSVEVTARIPATMNFDVYLSMYGYSRADILILPESLAGADVCTSYFHEIGRAWQEALPNLGLYEQAGRVYGLCVYDAETGGSLISSIRYATGGEAENYYLFFGQGSPHISDLSDPTQKNEMDGALVVARRLLQL